METIFCTTLVVNCILNMLLFYKIGKNMKITDVATIFVNLLYLLKETKVDRNSRF